jgi:hypothetical protein
MFLARAPRLGRTRSLSRRGCLSGPPRPRWLPSCLWSPCCLWFAGHWRFGSPAFWLFGVSAFQHFGSSVLQFASAAVGAAGHLREEPGRASSPRCPHSGTTPHPGIIQVSPQVSSCLVCLLASGVLLGRPHRLICHMATVTSCPPPLDVPNRFWKLASFLPGICQLFLKTCFFRKLAEFLPGAAGCLGSVGWIALAG